MSMIWSYREIKMQFLLPRISYFKHYTWRCKIRSL